MHVCEKSARLLKEDIAIGLTHERWLALAFCDFMWSFFAYQENRWYTLAGLQAIMKPRSVVVAPTESVASNQKRCQVEEGQPIDVGDEDFAQQVLESDVPVLVDFWAPWCEPCRTTALVLESIAKTYAGRLKVCKLNVSEERQTPIRYSVMSIPTLLVFKDGKPLDQLVGVTPRYESDIEEKIGKYVDEG